MIDYGQKSAIARFCQQEIRLVLMKQVHQDKIKLIKSLKGKNKITLVDGFDGLVTQQKNIILGIHTADCCPVLFYEPVRKIAGVVHAGWQGTRKKIIAQMIKKIKDKGGKAENIIVVIGPHICGSCYNIPKERAKLFEKEFVCQKGDEFYLDLGRANVKQLTNAGVLAKNMEILPSCTFHQNERFFSYRKNKGNDYGEMLAFIELR